MKHFSTKYALLLLLNFSTLAALKLPFDLFNEPSADKGTMHVAPIADQINFLEKDLQSLEKELAEKDFSKRLKEINQKTTEIKNSLEKDPGNEFLTMSLASYNAMYQVITETEQAYKDQHAIIEQHSKVLHEYQEDPQFNKLRIERKTYYTFDELQKIGNQLHEYEDRFGAIQEKSKTVAAELAGRKKKLTVIENDLKSKERQREELLQGSDIGLPTTMSPKDKGEIVDQQIKVLELKKESMQAKITEAEKRSGLLDSQRFILQDQVRLLKNEYARVKAGVRVDDMYVKKMRASLDKKRAETLKKEKRNAENIQAVNSLQEELEQELETLSQKYQVSVTDLPLPNWTMRQNITTNEWIANALISNAYEEITTYETSKELIQAQSDLEGFKLKSQETLLDIVESWHKMTMLKNAVDTDDELRAEIKKYDGSRSELQAELNSTNEKLSLATTLLTTLHNALDDIKEKKQSLKKQKDQLFAGKEKEFELAAQALADTEETIRTRIDATAKLVETYSAQQNTISNTLKEIDHIVRELNLKDFWQPSALAIDWATEMPRIVPDIKLFFNDLSALSSSYTLKSLVTLFVKKAKEVTSNFWQLLFFIINLILVLVIFFLLKIYLPEARDLLYSIGATGRRRYQAALLGAFFLGFIDKYLIFIYSWLVIWLLIQLNIFYDIYFVILFYICSIPLFIFLFNRLFVSLSSFNKQYDYLFLSESYERRFILVVSWLAYALSTIFFFRYAFKLLNYHQSNLPAVLLAIMVILCQIAAIMLIGREQILHLIPGKTELGSWIRQQIEKYYYVLVVIIVGIIVMSNPYVGFFRQVSYFVTRLLITAISIPLFLRLHNFLKNRSSSLFFYTEGETYKERFSYAKAAYGLMVIATFLAFVVVSILILSRVWDYPITFQDIKDLLSREIMPSPGLDAEKHPIRITSWSLLQVLAYVAFGLFLVFFINRMVLGRLFDLLLVNMGVQNTLFTLTRYFIITLSFLIGLQSVHLGYLITYIGAALLTLSFALKEPLSDVICYFVILVQRPIKIGDFIKLDDHISGVVRQITPRSVILRKKNSVTLVVPNSQFITKPIVNWNYTQTYFAFGDINISISYQSNPKLAQDLIYKVLHEYPDILKSPAPIVRLKQFTELGYQFMARGYLSADKTLEQWDIQSNVRLEIVKTLTAHGIEVAIPPRILRVMGGTLPIPDESPREEEMTEEPPVSN